MHSSHLFWIPEMFQTLIKRCVSLIFESIIGPLAPRKILTRSGPGAGKDFSGEKKILTRSGRASPAKNNPYPLRPGRPHEKKSLPARAGPAPRKKNPYPLLGSGRGVHMSG